jgi:hypothetical protein
MEQLPVVCVRRGRTSPDQRLDVVGREDSEKRWLRSRGCQRKAPLLAKYTRNGAPSSDARHRSAPPVGDSVHSFSQIKITKRPRKTVPLPCHPEEAESIAKARDSRQRACPELAEGTHVLSRSVGAASGYMGPSARKNRGPQDDRQVGDRGDGSLLLPRLPPRL